MERRCPALFISAPASGQGKTTVTAGLARYHRNQGRRVRVFKTGPDFLDPMILERAAGQPVYQLDLWMVGEARCRRLLYEAAAEADLILIEGVMGLFDGDPSGADLAERFGVPVLAVINAAAMAQTFGAVAGGLARHRPGLPFAGVLANNVAGPGHDRLLAGSLPGDIRYFGGLPRAPALELPDRHLGLVQAEEVDDLEDRLEAAARAVAQADVTTLPEPVAFRSADTRPRPRLLEGVRIGIARDSAFAFIYPANLDLLRELGAELRFFSPLSEEKLPAVDSLWLPGGYPELHAERLQANDGMKAAILGHHRAGRPIVAECGGMLYLLESLTDADGRRARMAGLLPGHGRMQRRLAALGLQSFPLPEGELRGHTFHHSVMETALRPFTHAHAPGGGKGEAVYRKDRLHASYLHLYFPSSPQAAAALFRPR